MSPFFYFLDLNGKGYVPIKPNDITVKYRDMQVMKTGRTYVMPGPSVHSPNRNVTKTVYNVAKNSYRSIFRCVNGVFFTCEITLT